MPSGRSFLTVSNDGDLPLSPELRDALDLKPGTRLQVAVRGNRLFLQPLNAAYFASLRGVLRREDLPFEAVREAKADELALENGKLKRLSDAPR